MYACVLLTVHGVLYKIVHSHRDVPLYVGALNCRVVDYNGLLPSTHDLS